MFYLLYKTFPAVEADVSVVKQQIVRVDGAPEAAAHGGGSGGAAMGGGVALALAGLPLPSGSAAVVAAHKAGQPVLDLSILDEASPQGFYLPDSGLEELADCFAVVGGTRLPLHSQVLGAQSAVLRDLFRSRKEGGVAAEVRRGRLVLRSSRALHSMHPQSTGAQP